MDDIQQVVTGIAARATADREGFLIAAWLDAYAVDIATTAYHRTARSPGGLDTVLPAPVSTLGEAQRIFIARQIGAAARALLARELGVS